MATKTKPKARGIVHALECRSVLTAGQAENCPLCALRAAAPELLAALKRMVSANLDAADFDAACAAIAKAEAATR